MKLNRKNTLYILTFIFILLIGYFIFLHDYVINTEWYYYLFEMKSDHFLNGRLDDYTNIFEIKPIHNIFFGSGVGSYYENYGYSYIHNIIGMVYYEQGVIFSIILTIIILYSSFKLIISREYETRILILFLFSTSIIRLMVSYYFWIDQIFWIYVSVVLSHNYKKVYKYREDNHYVKSHSCNSNV